MQLACTTTSPTQTCFRATATAVAPHLLPGLRCEEDVWRGFRAPPRAQVEDEELWGVKSGSCAICTPLIATSDSVLSGVLLSRNNPTDRPSLPQEAGVGSS